VIVTFSLLIGIGWTITAQLATLAGELPKYKINLRQKIVDMKGLGKGGAVEKVQETIEEIKDEIKKDLGIDLIVMKVPDPWPFSINWGSETRRQFNLRTPEGETWDASTLVRNRFANGIGAPGKWVKVAEGVSFVSSLPPSGEMNPIEVPMAIRDFLPNEKLDFVFGGIPMVTRTDMDDPTQKTGGGLTVEEKEMLKAIDNKEYDGDFDGIPIIKYESALYGEVKKPGLGPLHTEFDDKGFAYTSFFVSSEIVKWNLKTLEVVDRVPTYYSVGHRSIPGGPTKKPWGKYLIAYNKITKDRYLPTGPELAQSAQLYSIDGDKMKLLLDFPTIGEPHYAEAIPASLIMKNSQKIYKIEENKNPFAALGDKFARVERKGNEIHVYMTSIRSHFTPDNIEGVKMGDVVYFHVTNLEQDWDVPHGFAVKGANNAELLIMPGETQTLAWKPEKPGVYPMYCTDFCSALHQEMQGYIRVSPAGSNVPITFSTGKTEPVVTAAPSAEKK
jgi:hypothetical protein